MATDLLNSLSAAGGPFYAEDFSLPEFVGQYDTFFNIGLTDEQKRHLIEDLFGPTAPGSNVVTIRTETEPLVNPDGWS
jgi:hypothetical protein